MSRIGKMPITLPSNITFSQANGKVTVKGPKGELSQVVDPDFKITVENGEIVVERPSEQKRHKALHGFRPGTRPLRPVRSRL